MNNLPEKLRDYLREKDPELADRANNLWLVARPILDRQTRPGDNENGFSHVQTVENNIWRLLKDTGKLAEFSSLELFILSCAALSHDFDKGLFEKRPDGVAHGKGSGDFLSQKYRELQQSFPETVAMKKIIGLHALSPKQFLNELSTIERTFPLGNGPVRLQLLAVLLKTGDILHTDNSRIAGLATDTSAMDDFELKKHRAREAISGWDIDGSRIVIQAVPETQEHLAAVQGCRDFIKNEEWPAVRDKLADFGFPYELDFRIDTSICGKPEPPAPIKEQSPGAPAASSSPKFSLNNYVFTVPYREKGKGVVGREEALAQLRRQLTTAGGTAIGQTASFHGIGGLGKTQLAVEYAYRYKDSYPRGVIWITADQDIDTQLVQAARKGCWISPESEHKLILEIALRRLKTVSDCLIIFDNVEQLADIQDYLPEPEADPHLILTSRVPQEGFTAIDLSLLSPELSRELLLLESGRNSAGLSGEEQDAALAIITELGRLPLAIELAGAYLKKRRTLSFAEYLSLLRKNPMSALPQQFAGFTKHEADLYRTLRISEHIYKEEPLFKAILDVLTWSGSTFMGISLLAQMLAVGETELLGPLSLGTDLRIFRKDTQENRYEIHRLLRTVHRLEFPVAEHRKWAQAICARTGDWFENKREDFLQLSSYEVELDHLVEWQKIAANLGSEQSSRLLWLQAYPPYHLGNYKVAFTLVQDALESYKQGAFDTPLLEAHIRNDLGSCFRLLGNHKKAFECTKKALKIRENTLGSEHPHTATSLNNIGSIYGDMGKHAEALEFLEKALKIGENTLGQDHPDTATSLNNIGGIYKEFGKHAEALEFLARALKICENTLGPEHPKTINTLQNIILAELEKRQFPAAQKRLRKEKEEKKKEIGDRGRLRLRWFTRPTSAPALIFMV